MGLVSMFLASPSPGACGGDVADDRRPALVHVHKLDPHGLCRAALQPVQHLDLVGEGVEELGSQVPIGFELRYLLGVLSAAQEVHAQPMRRRDLAGEHRLDFVRRTDAIDDRQKSVEPRLVGCVVGDARGLNEVVQLDTCEGQAAAAKRIL